MDMPNSTQRLGIAAGVIAIIAAIIWFMQPAHAGDRLAFAGKGICIGEDPRFQCTPYFKPDRCNPAVGNWVNASDQTCPPDAWNDTHDRYQGRKHHKRDEEKS